MEPVANDNRRPLSRRERAVRAPLVERRRAERTLARGRVRALTSVPLTEAQRARDPLLPRRTGAFGRLGWVLLVLIGSILVHGGILGLPFLIGGKDDGRRRVVRQEVKIEVAEKKIEPPPPPVIPPPEPERRLRPKVVEQKAPEPPKPQPSKAPPRVVGLSLESTIEGGAGEGSGPAFAVGNTRDGSTDGKARNPREIPKETPPPADLESKTNRVAARIPVAGVKYEPPKRKRPIKPPYPETLKSQGIEADVTVMLSLDTEGKVTSVKIIRASEYPEFNELAKKTAMSEEFDPATKDGVPIPYTISYSYQWRLEEQ